MLFDFRKPLVVAFCLCATLAAADSLPLPDRLIDLRSPQGEALLLEAQSREAFLPISVTFVTQKTQAYCGVASIVMTLNAMGVPAPTSPEYQPYTTFTQDNVLDARTETVLPQKVLERQGMTLDQLGDLLKLHPVAVEVHHAAPGGLDEFRKLAGEALGAHGRVVLINYLRKALGQERGGHISPLAAYDAKADRFLILDVARYKYPPVWVATTDLFEAMNTTDSDNDDKTRGYVLISEVSPKAGAPAAPVQPVSTLPAQ